MADGTRDRKLVEAAPPSELRERVLSRCRREMAGRVASERHRQRQWRLGFAAIVAGLLLLNGMEEHRTGGRIQQLVQRPNRVIVARKGSPAVGSLRARATLLAALLRDPNAL
jgi:hypothetical protein